MSNLMKNLEEWWFTRPVAEIGKYADYIVLHITDARIWMVEVDGDEDGLHIIDRMVWMYKFRAKKDIEVGDMISVKPQQEVTKKAVTKDVIGDMLEHLKYE